MRAETMLTAPSETRTHNVLVLSSTFPSSVQPIHGVFVKERMRFVSQTEGTSLRVVSPVPYFPPLKFFPRWYPLSQISRNETIDGLEITRPRYPLIPKLGGYYHAELMYPFAKRAVERIRRNFDFDLIDAHFIYPDGVVACWLADHYKKPVVITCRGEDIEKFPKLPRIGNRIREALKRADQLIAVSRPIADAIVREGGDPEKVTWIPNGIDREKFRPIDRNEARRKLGLPLDRKLVIGVGYILEIKGFHILMDAVPSLVEEFPDLQVAIVGGPARWGLDYSEPIRERISANGIGDRVLLAGPRDQSELPLWYSAADVMCILSSREGSPNVLMEALSCGLPAVATPVGGIPDVLEPEMGSLLPERTATAASEGLRMALRRTWDRGLIREKMAKHSWQVTADRVLDVFDRAKSWNHREQST